MDTKSPLFSSSRRWKYHVFLSFRGEDTRKSFTDHLYAALKQKGIFTFKDDEKLERGKLISLELLKAIEESMFAIVILSKNYASSSWCLDELVKIVECKEKMGLVILPIFYDVDPSEVRKQTKIYAQAFVEHEKHFQENMKKVHKWRATLREVANLSGWSLQDRLESEFIQDIVEVILQKLSYAFPRDTKDLVGIDSRVKELMSLLAIGSNDVRIIGVWGMGGIGKTTLARVVYQMIFNEFEGGSFITNIREVSEKYGLLRSQQKLISEILMERSINLRDVDDGVLMIKNRLYHKRILLVLDDVNQFDQLEKLAREHNWFGSGSRVIITTRDKHLLIRHNVNGIYEVKGLNDDDALYLFSLKAFNNSHPAEDYLKLSKQFVNYANGLPLAIGVLGSFLFNRSKEEWNSALDRLKEFPERKIIKVLQTSFDGLQETEKEIFLHIACFFNMKDKDYVVKILDCLGLYPCIGLRVLIEKSLLKEYENKFWMHELLQKMGQDMVRQDCPLELGKHSKLWLYKDIHHVLTTNTGTEAIQGLVLELPWLPKFGEFKKAHWNLEVFSKMSNLKLLIIHGVHLLHGPKHLSNGLRFLDWSFFPSKSLPSSFQPNELVELHMCHSKIERLWKGIKHFDKLKSIELNDSLNLIATPNFTGVSSLEKLVAKGCINLREVHPSIMAHKKLTLLNLEGCKNLNSLPSKFEMECLENLILSDCSKIKRIPEFARNMECLTKLHLDGTAITKLPCSIEHLTNLASLHLRDCKNLVCLPTIICCFKSLKDINVAGCLKLDNLPQSLLNVESLEELNVSGITFREPPFSIILLKNLKVLSLQGCRASSPKLWNKLFSFNLMPRRIPHPVSMLLPSLSCLCFLTRLDISDCNLQTIPNDCGCLYSLEVLNLSGNNFDCLPESIIQLSKLKNIYLTHCTRLRSLPQLPSSTSVVVAENCTSLETFPNRSTQDKLYPPSLILSNCFKLADIQHRSNVFFRMLSANAQGLYGAPKNKRPRAACRLLIPGSEILKWFSHQSVGNIVNAQVTHSKEWMGMAVCFVLSFRDLHPNSLCCFDCYIEVNKHEGARESAYFVNTFGHIDSLHLWMLYFPSHCFYENARAALSQTDENELIQMGVRIPKPHNPCFEVKKCGFRMVYKQDIEDISEMMGQSCNSSCISRYEGVGFTREYDLDNSTVVREDSILKRSRDEYDEARPSDEGCYNDVPHSKRIQR
ncbi:TMV resistance protein N-like [Castanea sativa]|uniref:TMV resistance protein N-like n=1 Tax=Castanea sativa TaxID=21020 RepID=UPI003F6528E9